MKKLIAIALTVISLMAGYAAGAANAEPEIADVTASDAGIQIVYEDGTGYWYEF